MIERDKINVMVANLSSQGKNELGIELTRIYDDLISESSKLSTRLQKGRDYLMQVEPEDLTVDECLEEFGYNSNGF